MITLNREELAWAAGFYDGEGCTSTCKGGRSSYPYVSMKVSQSGDYAPTLLKRFQEAVGGLGYIVGPYPGSGFGLLPRYELKWTSFEACQAVLAMLWPFLGPAKRAQAKRVFALHLSNPHPRKRSRNLSH